MRQIHLTTKQKTAIYTALLLLLLTLITLYAYLLTITLLTPHSPQTFHLDLSDLYHKNTENNQSPVSIQIVCLGYYAEELKPTNPITTQSFREGDTVIITRQYSNGDYDRSIIDLPQSQNQIYRITYTAYLNNMTDGKYTK